ncbi:hypothetical protein H0A71_19890 [Alcaligenaceae bacterium]|nr:hypothetical protein [Alcaligenaceae bacterium]
MAEPYEGVGFAVIAYRVINKVYDECRAERQTPEQIAAAIDASYPWQFRMGHCYRQWLRARREFFEQHNLPGLKPRRNLKAASREHVLG